MKYAIASKKLIMVYKQTQEEIDRITEITKLNLAKNNHSFIEGTYQNRESILVVWCHKHFEEVSTTFYNYNRCRTGLSCCGKARVRQKLANRVFTPETLEKMSVSASNRPLRGGKPRRWRETNQYRKWRETVIADFDNECAVTGQKKVNTGDLVVHHLYSADEHPDLVYVIENGILLHKEVHDSYHKKKGYGGNTLEQFQDFLLLLLEPKQEASTPISSQANSEELEGSETRAYDPERVMKLQERLEKVKEILLN
jgi:hypothetical protein